MNAGAHNARANTTAMITAVALFHFAFILFVAFGALLVLRWHKLAWVHLPCVVWGILVELLEWNCPLTRIENSLLGGAAYREGFIAHYLFRMIYPTALTRSLELAIAAFVILLNAAAYRRVYRSANLSSQLSALRRDEEVGGPKS